MAFDLWVRKLPWRKDWLPTSVFLPGEFHGQKSPAGYNPWGCKGAGHNLSDRLTQTHTTRILKWLSFKTKTEEGAKRVQITTEQHGLELHRFIYTQIFFFPINAMVLHYPCFVKSMNRELWIQRTDYKATHKDACTQQWRDWCPSPHNVQGSAVYEEVKDEIFQMWQNVQTIDSRS